MVDFNQSAAPEIDNIQYNLFANIGVNTAHADTLQWTNAQVSSGVVGFNTVYQNVPQPGPGNGGLTLTSWGPTATMTNMLVTNDTIIQTAAGSSNFTTGIYDGDGGTASNVVFHDLYIDPTGSLNYTGTWILPTGYVGDTLANPTAISNVIDMVSGTVETVPTETNKSSQGYYVSPDAAGYSPSLSDVYSITPSKATGTLTQGNTVTFTVATDENFTVTGTPTLTLNDGGTATYSGGSGTSTLTFTYTVGASNTAVAALAVTAVNLPNGATVKDSFGNAANLAGAITSFSGLAVSPGTSSPSPTASITTGSLTAGTSSNSPTFVAASPASTTAASSGTSASTTADPIVAAAVTTATSAPPDVTVQPAGTSSGTSTSDMTGLSGGNWRLPDLGAAGGLHHHSYTPLIPEPENHWAR